ncbi:S8 family serine peptidase [Actinophytocola oryzae]|uniref:Subtilase family protein n=1 Tax=Actinophytocola oryzae TaxID=502181 RepID=A0A4R7V786_9PSEU|nr:S8 family serine peptidase [Actinophytocola oryzae]TDV44824.1 subtilase family protein [Actinophytocola oryzae]
MNLRRTTGAVVGIVVVASLAAASPAGAQDPAARDQLAGRPQTVTLLTGDEVQVVGGKVAGVRMAAGRETRRVWRYELNHHQHVVPTDVVPMLRANRLDERLFDVTELLDQGLDDASTATVPLILQGAVPVSGERKASGRGLAVLDAPKDGSAWREMTTARAATGKVWLNGHVEPLLEDSVPQVGAPQAWAAGFTGTGATVAVLDTGYDATHPDLANVVVGERDFTGEGIADTVGHGTHVASTVAGSGAASDGRRRGVAPGAKLLVGKVLGEFGGTEADIIAGMQWAVDQGADVVSMSLGTNGTSDGTDLMSQTLDELSDTTGTLFVVAAGNAGARESIGSPGAADRALTVGSVTKDDELSSFSSQGPRSGDFGLKPEIAAPGSDIIAARAEGTFPDSSVDEYYTQLSGTSMATPHVAGAAAILAGEHPDWTGSQLKDALVGSAKRLPGIDTLAQGAGRLDVARAVRQQVRAEGVLAFGEAWAGEADTVAGKVAYANDGDTPVTLDVNLRTNHDVFTVDSPRVTVPAHGNAAVTVSAHVPHKRIGDVTGALVATSGEVTLTTPLTASLPGEKHTLTVRTVDRDDTPDAALIAVQDERTGLAQAVFADSDTTAFTVPTGTYRVLGQVADFTAPNDTLFVLPTGKVDKDTELVVDTRRGREITSGVDDPDARAQLAGGLGVLSEVGGGAASVARGGNVSRDAKLYTIGSPRMNGVRLGYFGYWTRPFATVRVDGRDGFEAEDIYVSTYPRLDGTVTGEIAHVGHGERESIDAAGEVRGKIAVIAATGPDDPTNPSEQQLQDAVALLAERGAKLVLSNYNPQYSAPNPPALPLPVIMVFNLRDLQEMVARTANGPVTATVTGRVNSPVAYFLADVVTGRIPAGHAFRFARGDLGMIDRELVDTLPDKRYRYQIATWSADGFVANGDVELDWPHHRTDYVSPVAALGVYGDAGYTDEGAFGSEVTLPMTVKRGETRHVRMFGAPFGPELTTGPTSRQDGTVVPVAYRQHDKLVLAIPMFADADPADASFYDTTNHGSTVVRGDGVEIGRRDDIAGLGTFTLPSGPGTYTVVADAERQASLLLEPALSTRTSARWTVHTRAGTGERVALPFLDVRWSLPLDDHNRAGTGTLTGGLTVATQPGVTAREVRSVSVEVSYDEGATWRKATVTPRGDRFDVRIPGGGTSGGYASLRASATDGAGNAVTETVVRAYATR